MAGCSFCSRATAMSGSQRLCCALMEWRSLDHCSSTAKRAGTFCSRDFVCRGGQFSSGHRRTGKASTFRVTHCGDCSSLACRSACRQSRSPRPTARRSARGGDPFAEYMVPHAALRLKQGFGRLIRTATDRGAVIIADPRVITKNYGAELMRALPPARRLMLPWAEIARQLRDFYEVSQ